MEKLKIEPRVSMKISAKSRYGLIALIDMAVYSEHESTALNNIAERQNISIKYLEQIFSDLRKAEIVKSIKGSQGGYTLADKPAKITAGKVLRALEGDLNITEENCENITTISINCTVKKIIWDKLNFSINNIVDSITLRDLAEDFKYRSSEVNMYYI